MATCLASGVAMLGDGWLHPNMEICQQNDHFGLAFDIICKFREMEEKKYIFYPSAQIGLEGYCRHPAGGRAGGRGHFTVTALTGAALIRSRSNLVGTNLGAGPRTSSFLGDVAR